jgi:hypothetical protein
MFNVTMQQQSGTYPTKCREVKTLDDVDELIACAKAKAVRTKYISIHDGMDHGLVRSARFASATTEYVITAHKIG